MNYHLKTTAVRLPQSVIGSVPQVALHGPGPSDVHPRVLEALSQKTIGHLDPWFIHTMDEISTMLRLAMGTQNRLTYPVSSTGSAGMQTILDNTLEPGDLAIIGVNGYFGNRMCDMAERCGATVVRVEAPWGQIIPPEKLIEAHRAYPEAKVLAVVHAETSTGAWQPLADLGTYLSSTPTLFLVDGVTSLGGVPVELDVWHVDAFYSGTQKCLGAPTSLSPVSFSPKAVDAIQRRKHKVQSWCFDASLIMQYWKNDGSPQRAYHHTAPINTLFGLHEALRLLLEEGLENVWARHVGVSQKLRTGLQGMGFGLLTDPNHQLPQLTPVSMPGALPETPLRQRLRQEHLIEVGGGMGEWAGKAWRIGLMGPMGAQENRVDNLLEAIRSVLAKP